MYSTEIQAQICQSLLEQSTLRKMPYSSNLGFIFILGLGLSCIMRWKVSRQTLIVLTCLLAFEIIRLILFLRFNYLVDSVPLHLLGMSFILLSVLLALTQATWNQSILAKFPSENPYPVFRINQDGIILFANPMSLSLLSEWNLKVGELIKSDWLKLISSVSESGLPEVLEEKHHGQVFSFIFAPITEAGYVNVYGADITARVKAEQELRELSETLEKRVKERTLELQRSNQDLERFAHVVSHDLQEPLRMINSYIQLLDKRYKSQLDEKAQQFINFSVEGAQRMQQMLKDLLTYARVDQAVSLIPLDSQNVLSDVLHNLEVLIKEKSATVYCPNPLPPVRGNATQLSQLFQNILANSMKFCLKDKSPEITIQWQELDNHYQFSIADNGIGIEEKNLERIFNLFQRLHNREEYEGTGLGLSTCKKIIEQHQGKIWVTSSIGQGTTFYFTLLKLDKNEAEQLLSSKKESL